MDTKTMLEDLPFAPTDRCLTIDGLPGKTLPFFQKLLCEWGYATDRREDGLVLIKAGHERDRRQVPCEPLSLRPPFDLPTLWSSIESRFHTSPRRHIRLKYDIPAELTFAGMNMQSRFISFSDAGGRLVFPRELVRGEAGRVHFHLGGQSFDTPCEVIYVLPKREWEESRGTEVGIIFRWPDPQNLRQAREFIIRHYLGKVAAAISAEDYQAGLDFIGGVEVEKETAGQAGGNFADGP
jgi:hypothetical protein